MKNILIIDDDITICKILANFLQKNGYNITTSVSGKQALQLLKKESYDLILCDYNLGDICGMEILEKVNDHFPGTIVIFISGYGNIQAAVDSVREGAYHFLTKPLYPDIILATVEKALSQSGAPKKERKTLEPSTDKLSGYIRGVSRIAQQLFEHVSLVAPTDYSVIIHGETGTGKEALARLLHTESRRNTKPFVAIDCGSLSKELAASELFGHLKGSFTGAIQDKKGAFEMADGGTLFLDEIGNLSYEVQVLLLRALQEKTIRCIGEIKEKNVNVRVIAASNEDLYIKVQHKQFREDLYHRLNEFTLEVPPLRQRKDDILLFVKEFMAQASVLLHKTVKGLSEEATGLLLAYQWPGNIRELQNVIKRACLLTPADSYIEAGSLPLEITENTEKDKTSSPAHLKNVVIEAQRNEILKVLEQVNYNKTKAAAILNIDRKTLYNKLKDLNEDE